MTPKQAYAILEDMYSLELAEPEAMSVIKAALSAPSMEDELAEALETIRDGCALFITPKQTEVIANHVLAKYRERKK